VGNRGLKWTAGALCALAFRCAALAAPVPGVEAGAVVVNSVPVTPVQLQSIERALGVAPRPGRYWYDAFSGAWGFEGGPTMGLVSAGVRIGGPLRSDASGGGTGVFVNGRELHPLDVLALSQFTPVLRGRWWVNAAGDYGPEGGPRWGNLWALARQRGGGGPWSGHSSDGRSFLGFHRNGCGYYQGSNLVGGATFYAPPGC
jgi:hypothetical protein